MSEPNSVYKGMMRCYECQKSRLEEGVNLKTCAGCKLLFFCGKKCQALAWPRHKEECAKLQAMREKLGTAVDAKASKLRSFLHKMSPVIATYAIQGFNFAQDPSRATREVLLIVLRPQPGKKVAYNVSYLGFIAIGFNRALDPLIKTLIKRTNEECRRVNFMGGFAVVIRDAVNDITFTDSYALTAEGIAKQANIRRELWRENLTYHINNGTFL